MKIRDLGGFIGLMVWVLNIVNSCLIVENVCKRMYECHCHNVSVLRLSMKRLMLAFMSCYKMSCYHHQRFCLACCGQKGCLIVTL